MWIDRRNSLNATSRFFSRGFIFFISPTRRRSELCACAILFMSMKRCLLQWVIKVDRLFHRPVKPWIIFVFLLIFLGGSFLLTQTVFAQTPASNTATASTGNTATKTEPSISYPALIALYLSSIILWLVQGVGQLIVLLIGIAVVPLMQ